MYVLGNGKDQTRILQKEGKENEGQPFKLSSTQTVIHCSTESKALLGGRFDLEKTYLLLIER